MSDESQKHAFAFQTGSWRVHHRKLRKRLQDDHEWEEFEGTCRAWEILAGEGNVDDHWLDVPGGSYCAATLRRLEPDARWSIWWADSRREGIDSPMFGRFEKGIGTFFGNDMLDGRPIDIRFIWSDVTASTCRWQQAFSADGGITWETNWIMEFSRTA